MIFWDTSAIVPLLIDEPSSAIVSELMRADSEAVIWWCMPTECLSAIARRERSESMTPDDADRARVVLEALSRTWTEVLPSDGVRNHAARVLRRHSLRWADALALGAALVWCEDAPQRRHLATLDARLSAAARREGFTLALEDRAR